MEPGKTLQRDFSKITHKKSSTFHIPGFTQYLYLTNSNSFNRLKVTFFQNQVLFFHPTHKTCSSEHCCVRVDRGCSSFSVAWYKVELLVLKSNAPYQLIMALILTGDFSYLTQFLKLIHCAPLKFVLGQMTPYPFFPFCFSWLCHIYFCV